MEVRIGDNAGMMNIGSRPSLSRCCATSSTSNGKLKFRGSIVATGLKRAFDIVEAPEEESRSHKSESRRRTHYPAF
jgi:hypothetical protein